MNAQLALTFELLILLIKLTFVVTNAHCVTKIQT